MTTLQIDIDEVPVKIGKANNDGFEVFSEERMTKLKAAYDEHHAKLEEAEAASQDKPETGKKSK